MKRSAASRTSSSRQSKSHQSSSPKIRYAVVGLGHISQVAVLPAFRSAANSELTAIVSGDSEKLRKLARKYGLSKEQTFPYREYDRALATVDAVYLTLPNHLHKEYAVRAAQAGVHVLCEKPMAVTSEECKAMIGAAEHNNVKLMIAYRLHFERANLEAVQIASSRKLGDLRIFASEFAQQVASGNIRVTEPAARGGGALYDMGVYCINATRYLFQADPTSVFAVSASNDDKRFMKVEEMVSVLMRFPEERMATFTCSFGAADISRYVLIGAKGTLTADPAYDYSMALKHELTIDEKTTRKTFSKRDQFAAEVMYFSDCVLRNKEPEPSGFEGLADVAIVEAIYESVRMGRPVDLPNCPRSAAPECSRRFIARRTASPKP